MTAVLPGIDANDEKKTRAVFRFYCVVLASVGGLEVLSKAGKMLVYTSAGYLLALSVQCHWIKP